jgi:uncharacterized protein with HEPN domain
MQPKAAKWLDDIRHSADFILAATRDKAEADYHSDALLRAAVERHFEIIGEAMGRLARDDPDTAQAIADHRRIVAFRNVLIHGYDLVDHAEVWNVVTRHLPRLLEQVRSLLAEAPPEGA